MHYFVSICVYDFDRVILRVLVQNFIAGMGNAYMNKYTECELYFNDLVR